ncbi:unnamed protein product [Peronospora belbahrii]|uniref:Uncharacterized protein n=1 Tax=Peronospora belbahrii TaxID=622444 RepID=A0ABN8D5C0_9STRA|nr:unnamed protein product [Peronospora belbahrii]
MSSENPTLEKFNSFINLIESSPSGIQTTLPEKFAAKYTYTELLETIAAGRKKNYLKEAWKYHMRKRVIQLIKRALMRWQKWMEYVTFYNKEYPDRAVTIDKSLMKYYKDERLGSQIVNRFQLKKRAEPNDQQKKWLKSKLHPDEVFCIDKLDKPIVSIINDDRTVDDWFLTAETFNAKYLHMRATIRESIA